MLVTMTPLPDYMPAIKRGNLALRLRQNWLAKHPIDAPPPTVALDDSLTSLNWLQHLNIPQTTAPTMTPPASPEPQESLLAIGTRPVTMPPHSYPSNMQVNSNSVLKMTSVPRIKTEPGLATSLSVCPQQMIDSNSLSTVNHTRHFQGISPPALTSQHARTIDKIDYKTNAHVKAPYSYATLICMAMRESKENKITLAGIYTWITDNFMYYRVADPAWQNSIRHNLSLNKCFEKVSRRKDEPGKGGFWRINPEHQDMFVKGIFKKRRYQAGPNPAMDVLMPPVKKVKREHHDDSSSSSSSYHLIGTVHATTQPDSHTPHRYVAESQQQHSTREADEMLTISSDISDALDSSWSAILHQDIEMSGVKVETEDIMDEKDEIARPITALSPPPSENSLDVSLEELLHAADLTTTDIAPSIDLTDGNVLDLTVQGLCIKAPTWWDDSFGGDSLPGMVAPQNENFSDLSTPVHQTSPSHELDFSHLWAEDKNGIDQAFASFDTEFSNLFDIENLSSPLVD